MANRVLVGNRSGTYGLFVSRPGQNVVDCPDGQLSFDSRVKGVWVVTRGTIIIPAASGTGSVTYSNLGFTPIVEIRRFGPGYIPGQEAQYATLGDWGINASTTGITWTRPNTDVGDTKFTYIVYGIAL